MSDEDYSKFLEKASDDHQTAKTQTQSKKKDDFTTSSVDDKVPPALAKVDASYTSDTDAQWEPVSLKLGGEKEVDLKTFKKVTGRKDVQEVGLKEFDPRADYGEVIDAVRKVAEGVRVFRVEVGGARCEYWVVGGDGEKMVGMRVAAVES